ncbi:MAG: hypothetical protein ACP5NI_10005, partial [Acetobacteraceae bacterium]
MPGIEPVAGSLLIQGKQIDALLVRDRAEGGIELRNGRGRRVGQPMLIGTKPRHDTGQECLLDHRPPAERASQAPTPTQMFDSFLEPRAGGQNMGGVEGEQNRLGAKAVQRA